MTQVEASVPKTNAELWDEFNRNKARKSANNNQINQADRKNDGKPQISFVLEANFAIEGAAKVFEFGAEKYSRSNWKKGLDDKAIIDSMSRHILKYLSGELIDPETNLPHVDHILCNALFLADQYNGRRGE